jgi:hypothetical protein
LSNPTDVEGTPMGSPKAFATIFTTFAVSCICLGQTQVEVQQVKELSPTGSLSTCDYRPTDRETPFLQKIPLAERATGSFMGQT